MTTRATMSSLFFIMASDPDSQLRSSFGGGASHHARVAAANPRSENKQARQRTKSRGLHSGPQPRGGDSADVPEDEESGAEVAT